MSTNTHRTAPVRFNSIQEAEAHFRNMGIDVDFTKCTKMEDLTQIEKGLRQIKDMGIDTQVKSITFTPFDRKSIEQLYRAKGIPVSEIPADLTPAHWGLSESGHIFFNPSGGRIMANGSDVVKHEIGHYFRNVVKNPVSGIKSDAPFSDACEIIAARTNQTPQQVYQKLENALAREVKAYSPMLDESFADMFSLMVDGRQFSKGAMLCYDLAGGMKLPNKIINGMKYDEYMLKLYENVDDILMNYIR